jgi:hypothetical protein
MSGTTEPVLVDDIQKALLIRLYPDADGLADAASKATAQGTQTAADGAKLEASQWEPVPGAPVKPSDAPATAPPVNVDVPYVQQVGDHMTCTMGNWQGEPTSYAYQWKRDGTNIGTGAAQYTVTGADVGKTFTCVVTATNALGSTAAPPSNGVVAAAP